MILGFVILFHPLSKGEIKSPVRAADIAVGSSEASWISALLSKLGDPQTTANKQSIADWIHRETYNWPPEDQGNVVTNNPMNTGQPESGSRPYNSAGVQIYPDLSVGLQGTYDTLINGHYGDILSRLRSGSGLISGASGGLSTWSGGGYTSV